MPIKLHSTLVGSACCFVNAGSSGISPPHPEVCAVYDQENGTLQAIQTMWDDMVM